MIKYNRRKRGAYNARTRRIHINDMRDAQDTQSQRIHIQIGVRYDGYNRTEYTHTIYNKTRNNSARTHVNVTNTINDIFPQINAPHNAHTYRAIAPYKKFIPRETDISPREPEPDTIHTDTRTVKCIILNSDEDIVYIGMMRRTRTVNVTRGRIDITLHRNKRTMQAHERAIYQDRVIHGITVKDIKAHGVEIYYI